jgi:hypothetical protein
MRITVVTIFPEFFSGPLDVGLVGRAVADGVAEIDLHDLRQHGLGRHRQVDDTPYGGGPGMVMRVEPLDAALTPLEDSHRVLLTPAGSPFDQEMADRFSTLDHLTLVCGRYEGVDQRIIDHDIDEEVSVGDVVLAGGEAGALRGHRGRRSASPRSGGQSRVDGAGVVPRRSVGRARVHETGRVPGLGGPRGPALWGPRPHRGVAARTASRPDEAAPARPVGPVRRSGDS